MKQAVQVIASTSSHTHLSTPIGQQGTELAYGDGRNPYFRDEVCRQKMRQSQHVMAIGFHPRFCDPLHLRRMSDDHTVHQGEDWVVDMPGIGGGFDDDIVRRQEIGSNPGRELLQGNAAGVEHDLLKAVYSTDNEVMLLKIKGKKTFRG